MIRTAEAYREGLRDGREVWIDNERVRDVTTHPALKPIIDVKARMYEMAGEPAYSDALTYVVHERAVRLGGVCFRCGAVSAAAAADE